MTIPRPFVPARRSFRSFKRHACFAGSWEDLPDLHTQSPSLREAGVDNKVRQWPQAGEEAQKHDGKHVGRKDWFVPIGFLGDDAHAGVERESHHEENAADLDG